jgi:hypothetical protein
MTRSVKLPLENIIETAELASSYNLNHIPELINRLSSADAAVRYWAAIGCAVRGKNANAAKSKLKELLQDSYGNVRIAAAEALCKMGCKEEAMAVLIKEMNNQNPSIQLHALNVLDAIENDIKSELEDIISKAPTNLKRNEDIRKSYIHLLKKLKPDWDNHTIR